MNKVQVLRAVVVSFLAFLIALGLSEETYERGMVAYALSLAVFVVAGLFIGRHTAGSRQYFLGSTAVMSILWMAILFYFGSS